MAHNFVKWFDIEVVIFPPMDSVSMLFTKILSMSVADEAVTRVGCEIRGWKPNDERKS